MEGKVLFFNNTYGFIRGNDNKDYYVNYRNIDKHSSNDGYRSLYTGQSVSFHICGDNEARNVKTINNTEKGVLICNMTAYQMKDGEYIHSYNVYSDIFKKINSGVRFVVHKDDYLIGLDTILPREDLSLILNRVSKNDFKNRKGEVIQIHRNLSVKII